MPPVRDSKAMLVWAAKPVVGLGQFVPVFKIFVLSAVSWTYAKSPRAVAAARDHEARAGALIGWPARRGVVARAARRRRRARPGDARRGAAKTPARGAAKLAPARPRPTRARSRRPRTLRPDQLGFISRGARGSQCVVKRSEGSLVMLELTPRVNACGLAFSSRLNTFLCVAPRKT